MTTPRLQRANSLDFPTRFNIRDYLEQYVGVLRRLDETAVEQMARIILNAWRSNRTVFCCGNGGSASSASHFIMDLTKLTAPVRGPRLRALALTENLAAISAISNDLAYQEVFVEQLRPFLTANDVVLGFSTSGASPNVIRAIQHANAVGAITLGITGDGGGQLEALAQHTLVVSSTSVQHVEDATMVVGHLLCLRVKELIALDVAKMTAQEQVGVVTPLRALDSAVVS